MDGSRAHVAHPLCQAVVSSLSHHAAGQVLSSLSCASAIESDDACSVSDWFNAETALGMKRQTLHRLSRKVSWQRSTTV